MGNTIDRGTLDRLIALGRARGELTADELHAALPVDSLDVDALVLVILELEAAGIGVEPEAFGPRPAGPAPSAPALPAPTASATPTVAKAVLGEGPALAARPAPPEAAAGGPAGASGERAAVDRLVLVAGLAVLLLAAIVLVLI